MRRQLAAACVLAVAFVVGATAPATFAEGEPEPPVTAAQTTALADIGSYLLPEIQRARKETWRWERLMRVKRTQSTRVAERTNDADHRRAILDSWREKARLRKRQAQNPPRLRAWICIHRHERHPGQGWASRTGNGYFGGLQMDLAFQRTYGPELLRKKGTADRWTAIEQIWVAERAYRSGRGFHPWPNTARYCGLL
jgi:hypothetical protein